MPVTCKTSILITISSLLVITGKYVTDSKSDGIRHFFRNLKSVGYLKSDRNGFKIFVSVQLYNYFRK